MSTSSRPWLPFVAWTTAVVLALLLATIAVRVPTRRDGAVPGALSDDGVGIAQATTATASAAGPNATSMAAIDHQAMLAAGLAYPGPGTPWPTLVPPTPHPPTATATATPDVRTALPAGSLVEYVKAWPAMDAVVAGYRLDDAAAVAVLTADGASRLWDSREEPALPARPAAIDVPGADGSGSIMGGHLVLSLSTMAAIVRLEGVRDGSSPRQLLVLVPEDVRGFASQRLVMLSRGEDGTPRRAVAVSHVEADPWNADALVVYGDGDVPPILGRFDAPLEVRDVDGDGSDEIVQPDGAGGRTVRRAANGYAVAEPFPVEGGTATAQVPAPLSAGGPLPPLPAELCFERQGAILCWPKAGGALETVWEPEEDRWRFAPRDEDYEWVAADAWRIADDGQRFVLAQSRDERTGATHEATRFLVLDRDNPASRVAVDHLEPWPREEWRQGDGLHEWSVDAAGERLAFVHRIGEMNADGSTAAANVVAVDLRSDGNALTASPSRTVATCHDEAPPAESGLQCYGVLLSPDGRTLAVSDSDGLSLVDMATTHARRVADHFNYMDDGVRWRVTTPSQWSPDGRWLGLRISHYEGGSAAWLDATGGPVRDVADSVDGISYGSTLALGADRIVHAHYDVDYGGGHLAALDPTLGEVWRMPAASVGEARTQAFDAVVVGGEVRFGMWRSMDGGPSENGIFAMPLGEHATEPRRLLSLPTEVHYHHNGGVPGDLTWAGDGSAFVLTGEAGEPRDDVVLIGAETDRGWRLFDATAVLDGARGVRWSGQ